MVLKLPDVMNIVTAVYLHMPSCITVHCTLMHAIYRLFMQLNLSWYSHTNYFCIVMSAHLTYV